jgi:hypothetical protein
MWNSALEKARSAIRGGLQLSLLAWVGWFSQPAAAAPATWFPDPPTTRHYLWSYQPCAGCEALTTRTNWKRMAELSGLSGVRFFTAPDESNGPAYSVAPDVVVLAPSALKLEACQLAFIIGHEIVHISQRHFDEDAVALSVYSGIPQTWTEQGDDAIALVDGDMGLAMRVAHIWQEQEREADWMGSLLAAEAAGCSMESGALAYLRHEIAAGGGLAAAHEPSAERMRLLLPYSEAARRLASGEAR